MEMSRWLSEMGIEENDFMAEYQMDQLSTGFGVDCQDGYFPESLFDYPIVSSQLELENANQTCFKRPAKQHKTTHSLSSCAVERPVSSVSVEPRDEVISPSEKRIVSDGNILPGTPPKQSNATKVKLAKEKKRAISSSTKSPSRPQDHVIAERKRREKLSQHFMALTGIVPGLTKMDKTSILGDSIKYLKTLQEKVKTLEEQTSKKESVVFVKKFQILSEDDSSSTDDQSATDSSDEALPAIEARISNNNVLIRIHCEKRKGVLIKVLADIEKLNLCVVNSSSIPFEGSTLDITVAAEMEEGFNMAVNEMVKNLRSSLRQFM